MLCLVAISRQPWMCNATGTTQNERLRGGIGAGKLRDWAMLCCVLLASCTGWVME